jgi:DNA modification methylase
MARNSPLSADALNGNQPRLPVGSCSERSVMRPRTSLRANPRNARVHSKKQIRQIANSIKAAGFIGVIIVDEDNMVLAGHARLKAAELLDMDLVPTITAAGLSDAQKRAFVLADNKLCENAGWDRDLLVKEFGELAPLLEPLNWNLTLTGFEAAEIDSLIIDHGTEQPGPEDIPPATEALEVSRAGEIWLLGRNRVLCGNAQSDSDFDRLMDGTSAAMVFADPPYNIKIASVQGRGQIKHPEFAFASGEMDEQQFIAFLSTTLGNAARVSRGGALHYVCMDWRHTFELISASRSVYGREMLNLCVWNKTNPGQGSFYRSQYEHVGIFRVGLTSHQNNIQLGARGRNRSNVWTYPGISGFGADRLDLLAQHPTVKPVALVADAIRDCTTRGDIVVDPFLGSGTTILAAERTGRRGYGLEFEPRYVDAAIRRWEKYTRSDAVLEGDGRSFTEIAAERLASKSTVVPPVPGPPGVAQNAGESTDQLEDPQSDYVGLCQMVAVTPTEREPK